MKKYILTFLFLAITNIVFCQNRTTENEALLVLNDKVISKEILVEIDPKIIDSVKVLKDKLSIQKYGEKGKNGTIEIYSSKYVFNSRNQEQKIIYVIGGIASTYSKEDIEFEKKYNVKFYDFGCIAPINFEEYELKNKQVFDSLKKKFWKSMASRN
jgi:hypothetical protein